MKSVLIVCKEPFLDKIPNLMAIIRYLSGRGVSTDIASVVNEEYLVPSVSQLPGVSFHGFRLGEKRFGMPSSVTLTLDVVKMMSANLLRSKRYNCVIGTGLYGNAIAWLVSRLFGVRYVNHCLEYPTFSNMGCDDYGYKDVMYNRFVMGGADVILTFDDAHIDLISEKLGIPRDVFMILPNAPTGEAHTVKSRSLREIKGVDHAKVLVLHAGGLGIWFDSADLARQAASWQEKFLLVFHTSHDSGNDPYSLRMRAQEYHGRVAFSTQPVPSERFDEFVSSADIGLAWYNKAELGYRCEYMGMAAGKIGNYLKCGIPVITNNFPSIAAYIDRYQCGICVERMEEIEAAIERIMSRYDEYRNNAFRCYREMWQLDRYLPGVYDALVGGN